MQLPLLEDLELTACHLIDDDLLGVEPARRLSRLVLAKNELTDASLVFIRKLTTMRELNLESNNISGTGFGHIAKLPRLEIVSLAYNSLTTEHLKLLSKSPSLRQLCLYRTSGPQAAIPPRDEVAAFFEARPQIVIEWEDAPRLREWRVRGNRPHTGVIPPARAFGTGSGGGSF